MEGTSGSGGGGGGGARGEGRVGTGGGGGRGARDVDKHLLCIAAVVSHNEKTRHKRKKTDRQAGRDRDRETETHREKGTVSEKKKCSLQLVQHILKVYYLYQQIKPHSFFACPSCTQGGPYDSRDR